MDLSRSGSCCNISPFLLRAGDRFYPCSGPDSFPEKDTTDPTPVSTTTTSTATTATVPTPVSSTTTETSSPEHIVNIALTPIGPGPWDRKARAKLTSVQRDLLCKQASAEFR